MKTAGHAAPVPTRRRRVRWAAVLAPVVVVVCLVGLGAFPTFRHALWHQISISVVRQPAAYDQLYFTKPLDLPSHVASGTTSDFSFAIKREGGPTTVGYAVVLTDAQGTRLLAQHSVRVVAGIPSVFTETFEVPLPGAFEVGVKLSSQNIAIAFHGRAS